eukprot:CAMPEP_0177652844 /NCGR_PEP_ID=MMETSP0447-20121125/13377_1 /TAXON_ID=0 /ORGANISM="Stygamoeba regulata, Strain BSH-02190019" /LENGTH=693 /DNA_ID=CAMNT_0019156177 /DNA_START=283 /DNA_END=2364 /DNA_ORIENTATION=+
MTPATPEPKEKPLYVEVNAAHARYVSAEPTAVLGERSLDTEPSSSERCADEYVQDESSGSSGSDSDDQDGNDDDDDDDDDFKNSVDEVEVELPSVLSEQLEAEAELEAERADQLRPLKSVLHILCSVPEVVSSGSHLKGSGDGVKLVAGELSQSAQRGLTYWAEAGAIFAHSLDKVYCVVGILDSVMGRRPFWSTLSVAERWFVGAVAPPLTLASLVASLNKVWRTNVGENPALRLFWTSYTGLLDLPDVLYSNVLLLTDFMHRRHRATVPAQCRRARVAAAQRCMLTTVQLSDRDVHRGLLTDVIAAHHRYQLDCACGACLEPSEGNGGGHGHSHGHGHGADEHGHSHGHGHGADEHAHHHQHTVAERGSLNSDSTDVLSPARFASRATYGSASTLLLDDEATAPLDRATAAGSHADVREHLAAHQQLLRQYREERTDDGEEHSEARELSSYASSASLSLSSSAEMEVESESLLARNDERLLSEGERPREMTLAVQRRVDKRLRILRKVLAFSVGIPLAAVTYFIKGVSASEGLKVLMPTWLAYIFAVITVLSLAYIQWRLPVGFVKYCFDKLTLSRNEHVRDPFYVFHPFLSLLIALVSLLFSCGAFFSAYNSAAKITKDWTNTELQAAISYLYGIHYVLYGTHACILTMSYAANKLKALTDPIYSQRMAALACLQEQKQVSVESSAPKNH